MPASSKERSNPAKPRIKALAKRSAPSGKPFLRFYYSEALRVKTLIVLSTVEKAKDKTAYRDALAGVVAELTDSGMEYYFLRPLKIAKSGFLTEQSAKLGMSATTTVLGSVVRNIIGRMDAPQLLSVCSYIRQLMK